MSNTNRKKQPKYSATALAKLKYAELKKLLPGGRLDVGSHEMEEDQKTPDGVCVMEAVSWVAGEPFSDHPECACPVLTEVAIDVNDSVSDADRQNLIQAIPALVGSKSGSKRTYFRRIRALAQHLYAKAADDFDSHADDPAVRLLRERLAKILGGKPTKENIEEYLSIVKALGELTAYADIDPDVTETLEKIAEAWNSTGVSFDQYEDVFEDVGLSSMFRGQELVDTFVDIATQRAD